MKIKTIELIGPALDLAVARSTDPPLSAAGLVSQMQEHGGLRLRHGGIYSPSTNWAQGGPIIEQWAISMIRIDDDWGVDEEGVTSDERIPVWGAVFGQQSLTSSTEHQTHDPMFQFLNSEVTYGPTPLIAAMRCYVTNKLGDEADIPAELLL